MRYPFTLLILFSLLFLPGCADDPTGDVGSDLRQTVRESALQPLAPKDLLAALPDNTDRIGGELTIVLKDEDTPRGQSYRSLPPADVLSKAESALRKAFPDLEVIHGPTRTVPIVTTDASGGILQLDTHVLTGTMVVNLPEQASSQARQGILQRLGAHNNVEKVGPNYRVQWRVGEPGSPVFGAPIDQPAVVQDPEYEEVVGWGYNAIGAYETSDAGRDGDGVDIAFIDTGFDYDPGTGKHPDLGATLLVNFTTSRSDNGCTDNGQACYWEDPYHGTSVMATATAWRNYMYGLGISPGEGVRSFMMKPMYVNTNNIITMYDADMAAAFDWVTQNWNQTACFMTCSTFNIRVGNVSIGWAPDAQTPWQTDAAFMRAWEEDVVAWFAASGTYDDTSYPARFGWGIVVTGVDENLNPFGSEDWYVDLSGPGTAWPVATNFSNPNDADGDGFWYMSGTSLASPAAAAVAVLVAEANPGASASFVTSRLLNTAYDLGDWGYDYATGDGLVQADCAVLNSGCGTINQVDDEPDPGPTCPDCPTQH